jgi:hypothetical protein
MVRLTVAWRARDCASFAVALLSITKLTKATRTQTGEFSAQPYILTVFFRPSYTVGKTIILQRHFLPPDDLLPAKPV